MSICRRFNICTALRASTAPVVPEARAVWMVPLLPPPPPPRPQLPGCIYGKRAPAEESSELFDRWQVLRRPRVSRHGDQHHPWLRAASASGSAPLSERPPGARHPESSKQQRKKNIFAIQGRTLLHPIRARDNWDILPLAIGLAGTGKGSLLQMLKRLFHKMDIGLLSNRMEKVFGLESFYDKKLVLGLDLNEKLTLDQALMHSMIVGEGVTVSRKRLKAISVLWKAHLMMAVNQIPSKFQDNDFSLLRRLFPMRFWRAVAHPNPFMLKEFEEHEMAYYLYTIVWCYEELLGKRPGASLWEICEDKFRDTRKSLMSELSVLEGVALEPRAT